MIGDRGRGPDVPSTEELRERAAAMRAEAYGLLDGRVGDVLREAIGGVEVAGSVALDLMVWRDLDLYVRLDAADAPRLLAVVPPLAAALAAAGQPVTRVVFRDEHLAPDPAFLDSPGLYLGLVTTDWEIDLWGWDAVRHPVQQQRHLDLAARLAGVDRDLVLRLKDTARDRAGYSSMAVYEEALAGESTTA